MVTSRRFQSETHQRTQPCTSSCLKSCSSQSKAYSCKQCEYALRCRMRLCYNLAVAEVCLDNVKEVESIVLCLRGQSSEQSIQLRVEVQHFMCCERENASSNNCWKVCVCEHKLLESITDLYQQKGVWAEDGGENLQTRKAHWYTIGGIFLGNGVTSC